jgi:hypothetical protein
MSLIQSVQLIVQLGDNNYVSYVSANGYVYPYLLFNIFS